MENINNIQHSISFDQNNSNANHMSNINNIQQLCKSQPYLKLDKSKKNDYELRRDRSSSFLDGEEEKVLRDPSRGRNKSKPKDASSLLDDYPLEGLTDGMENFDSDQISDDEIDKELDQYISNNLQEDLEPIQKSSTINKNNQGNQNLNYKGESFMISNQYTFNKGSKTPKQMPLSKHLGSSIFKTKYLGASKFLLTDTYQNR